jgi:hypothetical protein
VYIWQYMSFEKALREMIRGELTALLTPLQKSIVQLERSLESLQALRNVTGQLAPLLGQRGREVVLRHAQTQAPPQRAAPARVPEAAPTPKAKAAPAAHGCAVIGCKRPARSKGYCSAHYQKLRLLIRTNRRPGVWVVVAPPQSARDLKLPRGRAAARERQPEPVAPKEPPKPKAWVRKKGSAEKVSLH